MTEKLKVFVGLPNMLDVNSFLARSAFDMANHPSVMPLFHFLPECRHHDYARNMITKAFLEHTTKCDWLLMIDSDVQPHPELFNRLLENLNCEIFSPIVFAWIKGKLLPSVWDAAPCEQCRNKEKFIKDGTVFDKDEYAIDGSKLYRWHPLNQKFVLYFDKETGETTGKCRCRDTGLDPFVYKVSKSILGGPQVQEVTSVGAACIFIRRDVIEKIPPPWWQFLYKPTREIMITEDHFFCWKAHEHGFKVYADTKTACAHFKRVDLLEMNNLLVTSMQAVKDMVTNQQVKPGIILPTDDQIAKVIETKCPDLKDEILQG